MLKRWLTSTPSAAPRYYARTAAEARSGRVPTTLDHTILWCVGTLLILGVVMVYSASIALPDSPRYANYAPTHFLMRHSLAITLGLMAAIVAFQIPVQVWQRLAPYAFVVAFLLLLLVLIPGVGKGVNGAQRWIPLGILNLQPSEVMKLACVLYAADFTVRKQDYMLDFMRGFMPMAVATAFVGLLLLLQPDLGAFGVIVVITMGLLFLGGINGKLFSGLTLTLMTTFGLLIWLSPWRRERIFAYLNVWDPENALGKGYQLSHSLIAFGRGEWFGVGLGASIEKLHYLPEAHTDFILAVIGEELGFVGVMVVALLFYFIVRGAFIIGRQAIALDRTFAGLVAQGVGIWLGVQAFINMGVALGLLPTKGLTLPLVSYGGSAMLVDLIAVAILLRIDWESRRLMRGLRT